MKVSIRATPTASQHDYKAGGDKVETVIKVEGVMTSEGQMVVTSYVGIQQRTVSKT